MLRKKREGKGKGEKERYTYLNAEFQGIARKDKKAFLSDQCKEKDKNNGIGKIRDLKNIRDTKGIVHAKMSTIKERSGIDLREAEDITNRSKCAQKSYTKNIFMIQIIMIWPRARHPGMRSQILL